MATLHLSLGKHKLVRELQGTFVSLFTADFKKNLLCFSTDVFLSQGNLRHFKSTNSLISVNTNKVKLRNDHVTLTSYISYRNDRRFSNVRKTPESCKETVYREIERERSVSNNRILLLYLFKDKMEKSCFLLSCSKYSITAEHQFLERIKEYRQLRDAFLNMQTVKVHHYQIF